jgi:hypothetical protein
MSEPRKSRRPDGTRSLRPKAPARPEPALGGSSSSVEALRMQIISLESDLHRERKERSEEASMFSRMLLKVTEAEEEARALRERVAELEAALGGRGPAESLLAKQLQEMRALMAHTAELFEDLDRREQAISEFRSRGLQEARAALLRAAGPPPRRPSPPKIEDDVAR